MRRSITPIVAVALATLVAAGCGSDSTSSDPKKSTTSKSTKTTKTDASHGSDTTTFNITVKQGQPAGGPVKWKVDAGDKVSFVVSSDEAHGVHLHGYDIEKEVEAGGTATLDVTAHDSGSFEFEVEDTGALLGNLEVS